MERETRMLLWTIFGIGVLTVAFLPAAWGSLNHQVATGVVSNESMAEALWGQSRQPTPYVEQWSQNTEVPIIPGAVTPHITGVVWDTSPWGPQVTIDGNGFGNPPSAGQASLTMADKNRNWVAGNSIQYGVKPIITSWRNNQIVVSGFNGYGGADLSDWSDGQGSFVFAPGDSVDVQVMNPQTGATDSMTSTYPPDAPMPTMTLNPVRTPMLAGTRVNLSGKVTFGGRGLAEQAVSATTTSGTLGGATYQDNAKEVSGTTDSSGNFSIPYTAPAVASNPTITITADGQTGTESIPVIAPHPTLTVSNPDDASAPGQVSVGKNVRLTASANLLPPGYLLEIRKTSGAVIASGSSMPVSVLWTEQGGGPITYVSVIISPGGQVVATSTPVTINWVIPAPTLQVSVPGESGVPGEVPTGENVLLSATASALPSGTTLRIQRSDGTVIASGSSSPVSVLHTEQTTGSVSYQAVIVDSGGQTIASSTLLNVNWIIPWRVSLTGAVTNPNTNSFEITATANHALSGTGYQYYLDIYDKTAGQWVATQSTGQSITYDFSLPFGRTSHQYVAYLVSHNEDLTTAVAISNHITATSGYDTSYSAYVYGPYTTTTEVGVPWYTPSWATYGAGQCSASGPSGSSYAFSVWVDPWTCHGTAYYYETETVYGWHWQSYSTYIPPNIG